MPSSTTCTLDPETVDATVARLRLLGAAARAVAEAGLDTTAVLDAIVRSATEVVADAATILLLAEDAEHFDVAATHDRDPSADDVLRAIRTAAPRVRTDQGLVGHAADERRPMVVEQVDPAAIAERVSPAYRRYVEAYPFTSMIVVPVPVRGEVIGTFALLRRSGEPFSDDDLQVASDIAHQAGVAIENARLYARAEEARIRAEAALAKAENAVRARDGVLAVVSHDLRNPLSIVKMAATVLGGEESPSAQRRGAAILRAASQMERLIRDLLDVAQIEAGALEVVARPHALDAFLEHAADTLGPVVAQKQQTLVVSPCALRARIDRERLLQAVTNLVVNASKFSPPGTTIDLACRCVDGRVEIAVTDDGPGIAAADLPRVFDRFAQSHASGAARKLGVGLGLAIARGIAEAHGGELIAENVPPRGARLRILLPEVARADRPTHQDLSRLLGVTPARSAELLARPPSTFDPGPASGVAVLPVPDLRDPDTRGFLVRIEPGATYPRHARDDHQETILILDGGLRDDDGTEIWAGDLVVHAEGARHASTALDGGCLLAARVDPR